MQIDEAEFRASSELGAEPDIATSKWVVLKFGGSSVASADNWQTIAGVLRNRLDAGLRPLVVHSALAGASNALESILDRAVVGDAQAEIIALQTMHCSLAADLGLDGKALLKDLFAEMEQLAAGVQLVREVSPRVHVRMMALGELMSTTLGAAFLNSVGVPTSWADARELMISNDAPRRTVAQNYLSATCDFSPDASLAGHLAAQAGVVLTQGFIARNSRGETVLLGREGSDTSAAYFSAKIQARRLEIWTDVPGMFTADPRLVPSARLLAELHFDEAQELSSTGSRVLHPRCLSPLRRSGIPLFIRCTSAPNVAGTVISSVTSDNETQVKGVSARRNVTLFSMEGAAMWHEVGFLADAFSCFARHGISSPFLSTTMTRCWPPMSSAHWSRTWNKCVGFG